MVKLFLLPVLQKLTLEYFKMLRKLKILVSLYFLFFITYSCCKSELNYIEIEGVGAKYSNHLYIKRFVFIPLGTWEDAFENGLYVKKHSWGSVNATSCPEPDIAISDLLVDVNIQCSKEISGITAGNSINDLFEFEFKKNPIQELPGYLGSAELTHEVDTTAQYDFYFLFTMESGKEFKDTLYNVYFSDTLNSTYY